MEQNVTLTSQQLYEKRKIKIGITGLIFGVIATIAALCGSVFAGAATSIVYINKEITAEGTIAVTLVSSVVIVALSDFFSGFLATGVCAVTKRNPIKETKRTASLPVSWFMCLGAFVAGPLGTSAALASYFMCGVTMGASVIAFTPLILSILSKFVFKEALGPRVYIGICILVMGTIYAGMAPLEDMPLFYPGIACAFFSAVCFSLESIVGTYAADMIDEYIGCGFFRCFLSGIMGICLAIIVAAVSGNMEFFVDLFTGIWRYTPWVILTGVLGNGVQYLLLYGAFVKCGPARAQAMIYTSPFWSIPVGFAGHAIFGDLYVYSYSTQTIIGAIVVVIAAIIIVCKPSDLLNLREN